MTVIETAQPLPTPTALDAKDCPQRTHHNGPSRPDEARRLPTPGASHAGTTGHRDGAGRRPSSPPQMLPTADPGVLLPTPRATDGTKGVPAQRGSKGDLMLPSAIIRLLSPPTQDATSSSSKAATRMNPRQRGPGSVAWTGGSMRQP
jgi:DNA (cytosine-5)-methyltransferase 1